jgi:hypothetical protein
VGTKSEITVAMQFATFEVLWQFGAPGTVGFEKAGLVPNIFFGPKAKVPLPDTKVLLPL